MSSSPSKLKSVGHKTGIRIRGALAVQRGVPILIGFAQADELTESTEVDAYSADSGTGYQRDAQSVRIRKAADYYSGGGRMPNPILVNIREADFENIDVVILEDRASYDAAIENGNNWIGSAE